MKVTREGRRWLYRGARASRLAKLLNRIQAGLAARAVGPGQVVALDVVGRRTGRTVSFPVVVADFRGERSCRCSVTPTGRATSGRPGAVRSCVTVTGRSSGWTRYP
jgi:hypothetical protein